MGKLIRNKKGVFVYVLKDKSGRRKQLSLGTCGRVEAEQLVSDANFAVIEQANKASILGDQLINLLRNRKKITVEDAFNEWKAWMQRSGKSPLTVMNESIYVRGFLRLSKPETIDSINESSIDSWVNDPNAGSVSNRTFRLSCVSSFTKFCHNSGWISGLPARLVVVRKHGLTHEQQEPKKREPFTEEEIDRLLFEAARVVGSKWWTFAIVTGRDTGLRIGDICTLEWACFAKPGIVSVWTDKRDKRVELPVTPRMESAMLFIPRESKRYVFPVMACRANDYRTRRTISTEFVLLCRKAGIHGKSFHCLRHSYVTECVKNGVPMEHIAKSVGHTSTETTRIYAHA